MEFLVPRRGGAVIGIWCAVLGGIACLPFWKNAFAATCLFFLFWLGLSLGVAAPRAASCVLRVGGSHLTLRCGILFLTTRRLPLRFISGCRIVQTPLQRMTGTCLLFLYASGCTTLVPGIRRADAEQLAAKLTHGGKLL